MDADMIQLLDLTTRRVKKKWDNLLICDGEERSGKTTFIATLAYYLAHSRGKKLTLDNFIFDLEELIDFSRKRTEDIIIWDEAAFGGMSSQWQNRLQQRLKSLLMVTGKYRHTYFFIIPSAFYMSPHLAKTRSKGLIHVYSPDMETRGHYTVYNESQKTWIYNNNRKSETYGRSYSIRGKFYLKNTDKIIDWDAYEAKKDNAIEKYFKMTEENKDSKVIQLQNKMVLSLDNETVAKVLGVHPKTVARWRRRANGDTGTESEQNPTIANSY